MIEKFPVPVPQTHQCATVIFALVDGELDALLCDKPWTQRIGTADRRVSALLCDLHFKAAEGSRVFA